MRLLETPRNVNLVRMAGLEPARLTPQDFKSCMSTYSITSAIRCFATFLCCFRGMLIVSRSGAFETGCPIICGACPRPKYPAMASAKKPKLCHHSSLRSSRIGTSLRAPNSSTAAPAQRQKEALRNSQASILTGERPRRARHPLRPRQFLCWPHRHRYRYTQRNHTA